MFTGRVSINLLRSGYRGGSDRGRQSKFVNNGQVENRRNSAKHNKKAPEKLPGSNKISHLKEIGGGSCLIPQFLFNFCIVPKFQRYGMYKYTAKHEEDDAEISFRVGLQNCRNLFLLWGKILPKTEPCRYNFVAMSTLRLCSGPLWRRYYEEPYCDSFTITKSI